VDDPALASQESCSRQWDGIDSHCDFLVPRSFPPTS